jgi:hypothetical protein
MVINYSSTSLIRMVKKQRYDSFIKSTTEGLFLAGGSNLLICFDTQNITIHF